MQLSRRAQVTAVPYTGPARQVVDLRLDQRLRESSRVIVDLVGEGGRIRIVPVPNRCKGLVDVWLRHSKATEGKAVWAYLMSFRDVARFSRPVGAYTLSRILDAIQPRCLLGVASNLN